METIGARLKKIRLEKGMSLEEVHKKTKIHLNILKAIEEDSLINFNPIYIKGFLKIYCKLLGIDPKDSISDYRQAQAQAKTILEKEKKPLPVVKRAAADLALLKYIRGKIKIVVAVIVILLLVMGLFKFGKFIFLKINFSSGKSRLRAVSRVVPRQEKKTDTVKAHVLAQGPAALKPRNAQELASLIRLGIRAKENCWMQVKIDGKIVFQNILKKGRFENWQANEKIELSLGNAAALELEVNGRFIPALGRRGQAIKNILITKEGLSTSRW